MVFVTQDAGRRTQDQVAMVFVTQDAGRRTQDQWQ